MTVDAGMSMRNLIAALVLLEVVARIVAGRKLGEQGFLIGLRLDEPQTDLEKAGLMEALFPLPEDER